MEKTCILVLCYVLFTIGISPELNALSISSSTGPAAESEELTEEVCESLLQLSTRDISPQEARALLGEAEIAKYVSPSSVEAGGYYGTTNNQYSSFFGNAEAFLTELVEFFLFLALLSYVVGYEEWLPWEESE